MAAYHDGRRLCDDAKLAATATEQKRNGQPAFPQHVWMSLSGSRSRSRRRWGGVLELRAASRRREIRLGALCCNERSVVESSQAV